LNKLKLSKKSVEYLFRISCAVMLIGHGWVCLNGKMPLTALLWDENLMSGIITSITGEDWNSWVTSLSVSAGIGKIIKFQGVIFLLSALAVLIKSKNKYLNSIYIVITINLVFLSTLKYLDNRVGIGNLLEHAAQFCMPLIIFLISKENKITKSADLIAKISIAMAFIFHGLFAINFSHEWIILDHSRPGHFSEMLMRSLGIKEQSHANLILIIAGLFDFIAAVLIFTKGKLKKTGLYYMLIWGALTAAARPWSHFDSYEIMKTLNTWIPEMLYRAPHFMIPLCLILALSKKYDHVKQTSN